MTLQINPTLRRLAIVGRGRVGTSLARAFRDAGLEVEGPVGRGQAAAADVVLLCVPDAAIAEAAAEIRAPFVGHVSGATPLAVLGAERVGADAPGVDAPGTGSPGTGSPGTGSPGVDAPGTGSPGAVAPGRAAFGLHPLQTVAGAVTSFEGCGCAIAGSTPEALELARGLALAARMEPFEIDDSTRAAYHAAASIASNFVVTLEWMAERVAAAAGIGAEDARRMLAPLARQTVENWSAAGPAKALTGPIARGDELTVQRQRKAIEDVAPDLLRAFDAMAEATRALAGRGKAAAPAVDGPSAGTSGAAAVNVPSAGASGAAA